MSKENNGGGFTGLTKVMFIDPIYTIKNPDEKNPMQFLIELLDRNDIYYIEMENKDSREIRIENLNGVLEVLKEHFEIAGKPEEAEYFIFWEDK